MFVTLGIEVDEMIDVNGVVLLVVDKKVLLLAFFLSVCGGVVHALVTLESIVLFVEFSDFAVLLVTNQDKRSFP